MADEVFITVVTPRPLLIRTTVDEKDLHQLAGRAELKGRATPAALPELSLPARLTSLVSVPRESGKFDVLADVELSPEAALIKPGMACTLKFTTYRAPEALTIPSSAVSEDEADDGTITHVVYLAGEGGQARETDRQDRQDLRRQDRDPRRAARRRRGPDQQAVSVAER